MRRGGCGRVLRGAGKGASAPRSRSRYCLRQVGVDSAADSRNFRRLLLQLFRAQDVPLDEVAPPPPTIWCCQRPMPRSNRALRFDHSQNTLAGDDLLPLDQKPLAPRHPLLRGEPNLGKADLLNRLPSPSAISKSHPKHPPRQQSNQPFPSQPPGDTNMKMLLKVVASSAVFVCSVATASLSDGLAAYYPFDGNGNDASGNAYNASLYGATSFVPGVSGSALRFDGASAFARASSAVGNLGNDATIAFWFKPDASNFLGEARVFEKDDRAYWIFTLNTAGLVVDLHGENNYCCGPWFHLAGGPPSDFAGKWSAVALRKTGSTFDLFINGVLTTSEMTSISTIDTTAPLNFGNSSFWNAGYYAGAVDEARVYARALSDSEIGQLGQLVAVPEPSTLLLLSCGLAAGFVLRKTCAAAVRRKSLGMIGTRPRGGYARA